MLLDTFSIDGLELLDTEDFWFEAVDGLDEPDRRIPLVANPGADGGFIPSTLYGMRPVSVTGAIKGRGTLGVAGARSALGEVCQLKRDATGARLLQTVTFSLDDGRSFTFQAQVTRFKAPNLGTGPVEFSISIVAEDPLLYDPILQDSGNIVRATGGGLIIPFVSPAVSAPSSGGSGVATNAGNSDTAPVLQLIGPLSSPYVLNQAVGQFMQLNYDVPAGVTVLIDMQDNTILRSDGGNLFDKKVQGSLFFRLIPGANNIIFSTANSSDTGYMKLLWHNASISI